MRFRITHLEVDSQSLQPALVVDIDLEYNEHMEGPLSIGGRLTCAGRLVSFLQEYQAINETIIDLKVFDNKTTEQRLSKHSNHAANYRTRLIGPLAPEAITYLETVRERDREKAIHFHVELIVKIVQIAFRPVGVGGPQNTDPLISLIVSKPSDHYTVNQSDWVNKFSEPLGIGRFILVELQIPSGQTPSEMWKEVYERLVIRLDDMRASIRQGDWEKCMYAARKFFENLRFNEQRFPNQRGFKESLKDLFGQDNHNDSSFSHFFGGIDNFFNYCSKFIHDKDNTQGKLVPSPIPSKEDAYLVYSLSIGLLKIIGRKVARIS